MKKFMNFVSNLSFIAIMICCVMIVITAFNNKAEGKDTYIFGYRPIYILTESMEPTIESKAVIVTKEVKSIDEIAEGDIVTFKVYDELLDRTVRITHRIIDIDENGHITTKGDNNSSPDAYDLTIDNISEKTVLILNWFSNVMEAWATPKGKVAIAGIVGGGAVLYVLVASLFNTIFTKPEKKEELPEASSDTQHQTEEKDVK